MRRHTYSACDIIFIYIPSAAASTIFSSIFWGFMLSFIQFFAPKRWKSNYGIILRIWTNEFSYISALPCLALSSLSHITWLQDATATVTSVVSQLHGRFRIFLFNILAIGTMMKPAASLDTNQMYAAATRFRTSQSQWIQQASNERATTMNAPVHPAIQNVYVSVFGSVIFKQTRAGIIIETWSNGNL